MKSPLFEKIELLTLFKFEITFKRLPSSGTLVGLRKTDDDGIVYKTEQIVTDSHASDQYIIELMSWQQAQIEKKLKQ